MKFDKYNIYKTINKVFLNEEIKKEELQEYFISNSEVSEDIRNIYHAYRFSQREFDKIIKKIKIKIQCKDLKYFINQKNVVSLVDALNEVNMIDKEIIDKLFEIAIDLYLPEKYKLHTKIDCSQWNDIDYYGNQIGCDEKIRLFVEKINQKDTEKFNEFISNKLEEGKSTKDYEELLRLYNFKQINKIEEFQDRLLF